MSRKNKVAFIQNEEPAFIKQFKERIGYKEGPNIDTKRAQVNYDSGDDDGEEKEDEKPTVVVLKPGDITQEEADKIQKDAEEPAHKIGDKITFKKPVKRSNDSEETEEGKDGPKPAKKDKKNDKKKSKEKKKSSLLSFDEEEEES